MGKNRSMTRQLCITIHDSRHCHLLKLIHHSLFCNTYG